MFCNLNLDAESDKLLLDCLVQVFDRLLQRPHGRYGEGHNLVD